MEKVKTKRVGGLRTKLVFILVFALLALPLAVGAAVLVNDTLADGKSQNQDLADNSLRVFNGRAATVRTDAVGSVTFNMTSTSSEGF